MEGVGAISGLRQRAEAQSSPAGCLCNRGLVITAKALLRFQEHHLTYILLHSGYTREQLYTFPLHRPTVISHNAHCTVHTAQHKAHTVQCEECCAHQDEGSALDLEARLPHSHKECRVHTGSHNNLYFSLSILCCCLQNTNLQTLSVLFS